MIKYSYYNSCFFRKDFSYRNNYDIRLHDTDLEHSLMKESKNRCSCVLPIFMFWYSRFSFRNMKDAKSCMISWCITTSSLTICSWHDMTFSQLVQYSMYSKCLPFKSISHVQKIFKLNKRNQSWMKLLFYIEL